MRKNLVKIIVLIIVIGTVNELVLKFGPENKGKSDNQNQTQPSISPITQKNGYVRNGDILYKNNSYRFSYWQTTQTDKLILIPNYKEKKPAISIMDEYKCLAGINGGFYDTEDRPLGLVISENKLLYKYRKNSLHNGVVGITTDNRFYVGNNFELEFTNAVQTGPLLIQEFNLLKYSLVRDKPARRSVAMISDKNEIYFVSVYGANSFRDGPLLEDLPFITKEIAINLNIKVESAINMDGGTASAIAYTDESGLEEWQSVGSWWCLKQ